MHIPIVNQYACKQLINIKMLVNISLQFKDRIKLYFLTKICFTFFKYYYNSILFHRNYYILGNYLTEELDQLNRYNQIIFDTLN